MIGDSSLNTDAKQCQKPVAASSGKPRLQFKRQNIQNTAAENVLVDRSDNDPIKEGGNRGDSASSRSSTPDTFLATGTAERAFFNVCSVKSSCDGDTDVEIVQPKYSKVAAQYETTSMDSKYSDHDDDKTTCIKVVNEIVDEIETDHREDLKNRLQKSAKDLINIDDGENTLASSQTGIDTPESQTVENGLGIERYKSLSHLSDNTRFITDINKVSAKHEKLLKDHGCQGANNSTAIATSLVVDIHIPPNDNSSVYMSSSDTKMNESYKIQSDKKEDSLVRPCKHELNRFQRCYSDTSQIKNKGKVHVSIFM